MSTPRAAKCSAPFQPNTGIVFYDDCDVPPTCQSDRLVSEKITTVASRGTSATREIVSATPIAMSSFCCCVRPSYS